MRLGGVHHVSINVHDAELTGRFYTDVLGLETLPRPDFPFKGLWLRAGGQQIHLIEVASHVAPEGQHFAFQVDDIESVCAALTARGVTVSPPRTLPGAGRQAFFRDPSGNLIELNQPGAGA